VTGDAATLSPAAESVLLALQYALRYGFTGDPIQIARVALLSEMPEAQCWNVVQELQRRGLVIAHDGGPGRSLSSTASLTEGGREAVSRLGAIASRGPVLEFVEGLDELKRVVLNTVAEHELRWAGGSATRSQARTSIRNAITPKPDIEAANREIDLLVGSHLEAFGGREPSYRVTLLGLLASRWGTDALEVISKLRNMLRDLKNADGALFRYSWGSVRRVLGLPAKALNLAHIAITRAKLGHGLFDTEGDYWWATPPDLDILLEVPSGLDYVRGVLHSDSVPPVPTPAVLGGSMSEAPPSEAVAASVLEQVKQMLGPSENPTVRLQEAFERLDLHPAIAAACTKMFRDGHYRNAVLDAGIALVNYVKEKSGRRDVDGAALMHHVFSVNNPALAFNSRRTQTERDEQEGLMHLFVGAVQALRNPRAHTLVPDSPEEALETVVLLSFLAKRLDRAKFRRATGTRKKKKGP